MKVQLESTTQLVEIVINGVSVPARIWEGKTAHGIPVFAFITRIAPAMTEPVPDMVTAEFDADLRACQEPTPLVKAIPLRLIL